MIAELWPTREELLRQLSWQGIGPWIFLGSVLLFFGTLVLMPAAIARLPADYFVSREVRRADRARNPVLRYGLLALKNFAGVLFVLSGIAMLVLPGPGIVTILVGLMCLDFPGKRGLELRLVRQPRVHRLIAWIRKRANRPPLLLPPIDG